MTYITLPFDSISTELRYLKRVTFLLVDNFHQTTNVEVKKTNYKNVKLKRLPYIHPLPNRYQKEKENQETKKTLWNLPPFYPYYPLPRQSSLPHRRRNVERGKERRKKKEKEKRERKEVATFGRFDRDERRVFAVPLSICIRGGWPTYLLTVPPLFRRAIRRVTV